MSTLFQTLQFQPNYKYVVRVPFCRDDSRGEWCIKNTVGLWMCDIDIDDNYEYSVETFYFDTEPDAIMFTLRWT